nr:ATP-binding protein [Schlegelella koreensis]
MRRSSPRRRPPDADESWFGSFGGGLDSGFRADDAEANAWWDDDPAHDRAPFESPMVDLDAVDATSTFERIYRAFIAARAALGVALVGTLGVAGVFGLRPAQPVALLSVGYAALAISMWLLPRFRRTGTAQSLARLRSPQWIATIGADLVSFTSLHVLAPASSFNYVALLALPVLMAGVLTPRLPALATAAAATLALLAAAWLDWLTGDDLTLLMTQAGLAGSGFFVIALIAGELARRLAREELSARGSLALARQQAQLNRLVIEEMQDGVLVVDRDGQVRAANPAARRLLAPEGLARAAPFDLRDMPAWHELVKAVERAFHDASWPEAGRDVVLAFEGAPPRTLRARMRFTWRRDSPAREEFCVLFIEDLRSVQARSRQEQLAAMGRVSAGVAHEIRNPLAAISQANALLSEDATDPGQRQLMKMVADNVERLKRIVDDVMEVAPGQVQDLVPIDATAHVGALCSEWARANRVALGERSVLKADLPAEALGVVFDPEHLRRVLVNLLDNAHRHASGAPGSVWLRVAAQGDEAVLLSVCSDGAPIPDDVEPHLFEPFFSTRSRGTGLGLYICRELCARYGASIDYRLRPADERLRNEFFVEMRRAQLGTIESRLHLGPWA